MNDVLTSSIWYTLLWDVVCEDLGEKGPILEEDEVFIQIKRLRFDGEEIRMDEHVIANVEILLILEDEILPRVLKVKPIDNEELRKYQFLFLLNSIFQSYSNPLE